MRATPRAAGADSGADPQDHLGGGGQLAVGAHDQPSFGCRRVAVEGRPDRACAGAVRGRVPQRVVDRGRAARPQTRRQRCPGGAFGLDRSSLAVVGWVAVGGPARTCSGWRPRCGPGLGRAGSRRPSSLTLWRATKSTCPNLTPSVSWNHMPSTSRSPSRVTRSARHSAGRWTLPPSRIFRTIARGEPAAVEREDLLVELDEPPLTLFDDLRLKAAVAIARRVDRDLPVLGVSRVFLYQHPELRSGIEALRAAQAAAPAPLPVRQRASDASLRARLRAALNENQRQREQIARLREELALAHGRVRELELDRRMRGRSAGPRHRETVLFTAPRASSSAIPAPQTKSESDGRRADDRARASAIEADIHSPTRRRSHEGCQATAAPENSASAQTQTAPFAAIPTVPPSAGGTRFKLRRRTTSCRSYPPTAFASTVEITSSFTCQRQNRQY